jgi:hypothetical protein
LTIQGASAPFSLELTMNIYLDIETIPGQSPAVRELIAESVTHPASMSKPETIAKWNAECREAAIEEVWRKTSFDGALGHIAVIGYAIGDDEPVTLYRDAYGTPEAEREMLAGFFAAVDGAGGRMLAGGTRTGSTPTLIGHNVLDFDLRFIFQRAVMLGIRPPQCLPFDAKPWDKTVFDTMTAWAGARNRVSLDKLCRAFGIAGKGSEIEDDIDGSKVWDFVKAGRIADVARYCAGDVERVRQIHQRLTFQNIAA